MLEYHDTIQFLKDYRDYVESKGITSAHIARKIGISPQQLQNIYKKQQLTIYDITRLCNAVDYDVTINIKPIHD